MDFRDRGEYELSYLIESRANDIEDEKNMKLRYPMPTALCSYCLGETRVGEDYQLGNVKKIK